MQLSSLEGEKEDEKLMEVVFSADSDGKELRRHVLQKKDCKHLLVQSSIVESSRKVFMNETIRREVCVLLQVLLYKRKAVSLAHESKAPQAVPYLLSSSDDVSFEMA